MYLALSFLFNFLTLTSITIFLAIFGTHDLQSLQISNRIFGPLLFVILLLFLLFVLMNLLIGVLGNAYGDVNEVNFERWNRFITRLMIDAVEEKKEEEEERKQEKDGGEPKRTRYEQIRDFILNKIFRKADIDAAVDNLVAQEDDEGKGDAHLGTLIFKSDEELDDMLVPDDDDDEEENDGEDQEAEKQKSLDEIKDLRRKVDEIEKANEKITVLYRKGREYIRVTL